MGPCLSKRKVLSTPEGERLLKRKRLPTTEEESRSLEQQFREHRTLAAKSTSLPSFKAAKFTIKDAIDRMGALRTIIKFSDVEVKRHLEGLGGGMEIEGEDKDLATKLNSLYTIVLDSLIRIRNIPVPKPRVGLLEKPIQELEDFSRDMNVLLMEIKVEAAYATSHGANVLDVTKKKFRTRVREMYRRAKKLEIATSVLGEHLFEPSAADQAGKVNVERLSRKAGHDRRLGMLASDAQSCDGRDCWSAL